MHPLQHIARRTRVALTSIGICLLLLSSMGCSVAANEKPAQLVAASEPADLMSAVSTYQIDQLAKQSHRSNGWIVSSFYTGVMAAYRATGNAQYLKWALQWARENDWQLGPRLRHADDHCSGQTYLELYLLTGDPRAIGPTRATFDKIIADPEPGHEEWWWADALFMTPPVLARLSTATGDPKYRMLMHRMFWDATDHLLDKEMHLYYRDERFFSRRTEHGQKVFWSRGNGWALAGIARVLQHLPDDDPFRSRYVTLFRAMAQSVATHQGSDGLWRSSLLDPAEYPAPETSGSAFFCYALAWGINAGVLDRDAYLPIVRKAWSGLANAVHPNGKLGWVQDVGDRPAEVSPEDTGAYGAGAFLLAGSELMRLSD